MSSIGLMRVGDSFDLVSCRVCRNRFGEFLTLDSEFNAELSLVEVFNKFTGLKAAINDQLPQMMCQTCVTDLEHVVKFVQNAQAADQQLRESIKNQNRKNEEANFEEIDVEMAQDTLENEEEDAAASTKAESVSEPYDYYEVVENEIESIPDTIDDNESEIYSEVKVNTTQDVLIKDELEANSHEEFYIEENNEIRSESAPEEFTENLEPFENHSFVCEICGMSFATNKKFVSHKATHIKDKEFICDVCSKKFTTEYRLRQHKKTHDEPPEFICEICSKLFRSRASLQSHSLSHTGERPHVCNVCGKAFAQRSVLTTHQALHTGKKTKCPQCPKKFCRPSQLIAHRRVHTGERPYKCPHCENAYTQKSHLDRHLDSHFGVRYECAFCEKSYTKKSSLKLHTQEDHGTPKVYRCKECCIEFNKKKAFEYHMSKHRFLLRLKEAGKL